MNQKVGEIAARIRELRDACGYTPEQLAQELGIPLEVYRAYEDEEHDIPISVIFQIANKFKVDFTEIVTGAPGRLNTYHVVRKGAGESIDRYPGYRFEDLAFRFNQKVMQPLLVTLDPSDKPAALVSHSGQEFNMVLSGSVAVVFENKEIILNEGDCIYFNPEHEHGQRCVGDQVAVFLTVIAE